MVDELNLPNDDVVLISDLMDDLIRATELRSSIQGSIGEAGTKIPHQCMEDHNADASVFSVSSAGRPCSNDAEFGKGCNRYRDGERLTAEDEKAVVDKLFAYHPNAED